MSGSYSHQSQLSIDGVEMSFVSENFTEKYTHVEPQGITGSRFKASENVRRGTSICTGDVVVEPNPLWLQTLLKLAMGAFATGSATMAETLPTSTIIIDKGFKVFTYENAVCDKLVLNAQAGQIVRATASFIAASESIGAAGSGTWSGASTQAPLMLHDLAATLAGTGNRRVDDVVITIQNNVRQDRFMNSQTLTEIPPGMAQVLLSLRCPFDTTHYDLYKPAVGGIATVLAFTNGTISATFTFAKWQIPGETPQVPGRDGENWLAPSGEVRKDGSTLPLVVAIDSTP